MAGRPSKFEREWNNEEGLLRISGWARDGLTNEDIAKNMGISVSTLYEWQKKYSELSESLKKTKEVADRVIENALYQKAIGYSYDEFVYERDKETGTMIPTKKTTKHMPPDTTAIIFWLKNRKTDEWRDKQQMEHSGEINIAEVLRQAQARAKE